MTTDKNAEFDIFNFDIEDVNLFKEEKKESITYNPSPEQGKDGTYRALIRFIPNPKNPKNPILRKFVYWLKDSEGKGAYYDSPTSVGEKCPVQDLFFKLRNSDSAADKKTSEELKRKENYYAIVQIVKDPQKPELNGKFKVYKFGYKIMQKINEEMMPQFDEPVNIFNLFKGKNFELVITKQAGFPNYDNSKFQSKRSAITIDGNEMEDSKTDKVTITEAFKDLPSLETFDYKPWSDQQRSKIEEVLNQYRSPGAAMAQVTSKKNEEFASEISESKPSKTEKSAKAETSKEEEKEEDLDDFLNSLDL